MRSRISDVFISDLVDDTESENARAGLISFLVVGLDERLLLMVAYLTRSI
jgi:hypothetical protein